ncbi:hypothetical protein IGB42_02725 [Andreprevotia sp. IGB-42]|uniref:GspH/FimT family pseudopilin n=1 Tax=Andreprevotia sp. IGB-42 TaxID=2497473 RepID=UPI00135A3C8B|nr:GspH/FimT family pseudopilin [Andreprevotia sp. IGB-42]KAF0812881.1 hypothetical protein IGB42_02725 [Andreprevotia sp. IGB-42]
MISAARTLPAPVPCRPLRHGGFTLVELIIVMSVMAILLAMLAPRMFNTQQFTVRGFADQLIASLRFARETAIAQRAPVYVQVSGNQVRFCLDAACTLPATGADGKSPYIVSAPGSVSIAGSGNFAFDALGAATLASPMTLSLVGDVGQIITIEADTGYVH